MRLGTRIALWAGLGLAAGLALPAAWITQPLLWTPAGIVVPPVSTTALRRHVTVLARDLHPRDAGHHANLSAAGMYVAQELARAGAKVSVQTYDIGGRSYSNYSALFGSEMAERTVIGAHYDSVATTPGADDNASGVAGLIELARLLALRPPPTPVELVAYTLEESPYFGSAQMGSARHAERLYKEGVKVRLMISLEMIGYFSDAPASQHYPLPGLALLYPGRGDFISVVGSLGDAASTRAVKAGMRAGSALPVQSINVPGSLTGGDRSDNRSYWGRGMRAVMVTDTAFMRNPNYHAATDTPDTLDYARMAEVVRGVFAFVQTAD